MNSLAPCPPPGPRTASRVFAYRLLTPIARPTRALVALAAWIARAVCRASGLSDPGGKLRIMTQQLPPQCLRLLRLQRGVIASWQAEPAGLAARRMEALVCAERWQRLHYGVCASFTGKPPRGAVLWAAVLRAGPQAILSHETAAEVEGLLDKPSRLLHVTIPVAQRVKPIAGFALHRSTRILEARDPVLLPPRTMIEETVLDLAQGASNLDDVMSLLARACQRRLTFPFLLRERVEMRARIRWRAEILEALEDVADGVHSPLEYRYLRDVERAHGVADFTTAGSSRARKAGHPAGRPLPAVRSGRGTRRQGQPCRAPTAGQPPRQRRSGARPRHTPVRLGRCDRARLRNRHGGR